MYLSPQAFAKGLFQPNLSISLIMRNLKTLSSLHGFKNLDILNHTGEAECVETPFTKRFRDCLP